MKEFFKEIFAYHHYYNQQLVSRIIENRQLIPDEPYKLFCHILNAHQVWNSRILKTASFKVWEVHEQNMLTKIDQDNYSTTLHILDYTDLEAMVHYANSNGASYDNTVKDILFHVNNHSTYHRGQLASRFKALGLTPLVTDYIFYKREQH